MRLTDCVKMLSSWPQKKPQSRNVAAKFFNDLFLVQLQ
jgi:hypothetical protein